jgi:hypothetical protein
LSALENYIQTCVKRKTGGEEKYLAAGTVVADEKSQELYIFDGDEHRPNLVELNLHAHTHELLEHLKLWQLLMRQTSICSVRGKSSNSII